MTTACRAGVHNGYRLGLYSVPLGLRLRDLGGTLVAVEPVRANVERLQENLQVNDLLGVVSVLAVAVGDRQGFVTLDLEPGGKTGTAAARDALAIDAAAVRLTTLDTLARENGIDRCRFIKLDIEGFELEALRGAASVLAQHRPVVLSEMNAYWMKDRGWSHDDLVSFAAANGYACHGTSPAAGGITSALLRPDDLPLDEVRGLLQRLSLPLDH